jgi:5'-methylthioadenosine phosphorylase
MKPRKKDVIKSKIGTQITKRMTKDQRIIHGILGEKKSKIPKRILAVATPVVLKTATQKLKDTRTKARITTGRFEDSDIGIVVTGMGTPSTAIIMEAVIKSTPDVIIRADFCGGLSTDYRIGDGFLADDAVVGDGCGSVYFGSKSILPSHRKLSKAIHEQASDLGLTVHRGRMWTTDVLFKQTEDLLEGWIHEGGQAVDMESSMILGLGNASGIPTASLNCISDLPVHGKPLFDSDDVDPNLLTGLDLVLRASLRTLVDWS